MRKLLPIVEGDGDVKAVPVLIRRILQAHGIYDVELHPAQKRNDYSKLSDTVFDNYFLTALKWEAPILWVLDFDCRECVCVKNAAQRLYERASKLNVNAANLFKVAFVQKEFEALFVAEQNAVKAVFSIDAFETPENVNELRDAKGCISKALPKGRAYKETVHQEKIAAQLDLETLREVSADFRHLEQSVLHLVAFMR